MAFVVIYDACVLYPAALRDFLLRVARTGIVRARWSEKILDECFEAIVRERPDLKPEALERTRVLMREAIPDCIVSGHENLIDELSLPEQAAALRKPSVTREQVLDRLRDHEQLAPVARERSDPAQRTSS